MSFEINADLRLKQKNKLQLIVLTSSYKFAKTKQIKSKFDLKKLKFILIVNNLTKANNNLKLQ